MIYLQYLLLIILSKYFYISCNINHSNFSGQLWPSQNHHIYPTQQQYPLLQHHQLWPSQQQQQQQLQKVTFRSASHHEMLDNGDRGLPGELYYFPILICQD